MLVVMGFNNPDVSWAELEAMLSGRPRDGACLAGGPAGMSRGDGGDSPAWSRKREPYRAPRDPGARRPVACTPYAELHCHSNFSFLDGASHPEELVEQAARLGLDAIALTDHDGMDGVVRFAEAAAELGMKTIFGAERSGAEPGAERTAERGSRPRGQSPAAGPRSGGLPGVVSHDQRRPAARRGEGTPGL
ncbi:hypothetical protein PA7_00350 [Pseudonocardia asaccharolytica DSM 44247 = NBRC 16224]|uniref:Polymerase/histidinol phosphatase N-terminal domain-containing protein n=1 Tax=Pseudonocardia asaccharolytica DSM 44247 = NBRC 16224 TaxID=1123024 RepID=A0A511D015_9PSEU|nr:hypothetical protein PA7_00350 [Pseudonocardia asaccharolytica DSM 44247 = NBRC 16224]